MPKLPRYSKKRRNVCWKKDPVCLTTRELCAVVYERWVGPGRTNGVPRRVEELLPVITQTVLGHSMTLDQVRSHIQRTQRGKVFTLNALYQRGDKLGRYNEYFALFRQYVMSAYQIHTGESVREDFEPWMETKRLGECNGKCEYRGCDLVITGYELDHYIPVKSGGRGNYENLRIACPRCNREKSAIDPLEFIKKIASERSRARTV